MSLPISETALFNIGDQVWVKSYLDPYLDISTSPDNMREFIQLHIKRLLYKVDKVEVRVVASGTTIYYKVSLVSPTVSSNPLPSSITETNILTDISEDSLYSFAAGKTAILIKVSDFENYITSLT